VNLLSKFVRDLPLFFAIALLTIFLLSIIALYLPPPEETISEFREAGKELKEMINISSFTIRAIMIFLNNARVNTMLAVPFLSIIMYPTMVIATAWTLRIALLEISNNTAALQESLYKAIIVLLISPHTYLEMLSYSITFTCSNKLMIALLRDLRKRKRIAEDIILYYVLAIAISFSLLFTAAFVESYLISISE
jgi:uncharacterized membrane protein SpoIIM required for sporulation